jgi:hypothetical protein
MDKISPINARIKTCNENFSSYLKERSEMVWSFDFSVFLKNLKLKREIAIITKEHMISSREYDIP